MSRYSRQTILPELQENGQRMIHESSVLCVGAGGLGSPVLLYLAAAGVGRIGIIDPDQVDLTNLHRQILYREEQVGMSKALSAKVNLEKLNSEIFIEAFVERLSSENVERLFQDYDVIVDGTDDFDTKYLINDAAVKFKKTVIFGSVTAFDGQVGVFDATRGPCYRCLYPNPAVSAIPNCSEAGVLGSVVGIIGSMQATECLKVLVSKKSLHPLIGKILTLDARDQSVLTLQVHKDPKCGACSLPADPIVLKTSSLDESSSPDFQGTLLIDVRETEEWTQGHLAGAIHFPLSEIRESNRFRDLDRNQKIIVYCLSGQRSAQAVQVLIQNGFAQVSNLKGGLQSWKLELTQS